MRRDELIYSDLSYEIFGILFKVQNELGRYCNEKQYGDSIEEKLKENKISYAREKTLPVSFEGEKINRNKVDFIIENKIILELKCSNFTTKENYYQLRRYLSAYNLKLGILVNFRDKYLKPKRILNSECKEY
ncbi:MAG: GxxExxY protein [Parcubacteria group bacterium]|jgi:GxxExxY protein